MLINSSQFENLKNAYKTYLSDLVTTKIYYLLFNIAKDRMYSNI